MRRITATLAMALLASCSSSNNEVKSASAAGAAQLAQCPAASPLQRAGIARVAPVAIPAGASKMLGSVVRSNETWLGVSSFSGRTHCVDVRLMSAVDNMELMQGGRFVSFDWKGYHPAGYPADGHMLVDRTGSGQHVDTGGRPVFSPSGQHVAAAYQSETAFAQLEGFGVWQVTPGGLNRVALLSDLPEMQGWQVDGWASETCVNLSALPFSRARGAVARERFIARKTGNSWRVSESAGGCPSGA